ncbi:septum formation initiator family protein, partial [Streptacidiphilus pinicola]|uniref:septum formation initiator family protein n=1 Tax=Streptacidiphilus pinicola TaxID=2219663 RepID=UPI002436DAA1
MAVGRGVDRPGGARTALGLRPGPKPGPGRRAGRGPFAALVMVLLAVGLVALLTLNTALSQGSFTVQKLQRQTTQLTNEQQGLQQQIDGWSAPDALAARARQLGMVPAGNPAFLTDSGKVLGDPSHLPAAPSPLPTPEAPTPTPTPTPSASGSASPSPSASGHAAVPHTAGTPATHNVAHPGGSPAAHVAGHPAHPTPSGHGRS